MPEPTAPPSIGLFALVCALALATPAHSALIASGDGSGNTLPPEGGSAWRYLGRLGDYSGVYVGHGWALTAAHVGIHSMRLAGRELHPLPASAQPIRNADGSVSDLLAFRVAAPPRLPILRLNRRPLDPGTPVILAGQGRNRGAALAWQHPRIGPIRGWRWAPGQVLRWGTNRVSNRARQIRMSGLNTVVISMVFNAPTNPGATRHEAQVVTGDSGGALLVAQPGGGFALGGILIARSIHAEQPTESALYGNLSYAADIATYRDQIVALTRPDCSDEIDNDLDGLVDHPDDPTCRSPADDSEDPLLRRLLPRRQGPRVPESRAQAGGGKRARIW